MYFSSKEHRTYVVGIVSAHLAKGKMRMGKNCQDTDVAQYFTSVYNYRDWIMETMDRHEKDGGDSQSRGVHTAGRKVKRRRNLLKG
jgi:secreted trypsin-like serine protease